MVRRKRGCGGRSLARILQHWLHNAGYGCVPCQGTAEYLEQGRVIAGEPVCLSILIFTESEQDSTCRSRLHAVVIRQTFRKEAEALLFARAVIKLFGASDDVLRTGSEVPVETQFTTDTRGTPTFVQVSLDRRYRGFHVYVYVSQDSSPSSALRPRSDSDAAADAVCALAR
jgi:hypothetical protein